MQRWQVQVVETAGDGFGRARGSRANEREDTVAIDKLIMGIGDGGELADGDSAWGWGYGGRTVRREARRRMPGAAGGVEVVVSCVHEFQGSTTF